MSSEASNEENDVISIHTDENDEDYEDEENEQEPKRQKIDLTNHNVTVKVDDDMEETGDSNKNQSEMFQSILNKFPANSITRGILSSGGGVNSNNDNGNETRTVPTATDIMQLSKLDEIHATASKILLLITSASPHPNDLSHVILPLGEVENLAAHLVEDRRESLHLSLTEMQKSYSLSLQQNTENFKAQEKKYVHKNELKMKELKDKLKESLKERDAYWKEEIDKLLKEHERVMFEFRKGFQDEVQGMRDEMKEMKERHEQTLEEYKLASSKALEVIRKRVLGDA